METKKNFSCKHEEIVVICEYVQNCFQRDIADFIAYSPKFSEDYLKEFKNKTAALHKIVFPQDKTKELKIVTARLYANMDKLLDILDRLDGYLKLARNSADMLSQQEIDENSQLVPTPNDFGTVILKRKLRSRDAEGALKNLQQVNANIEKYKDLLTKQGLTTEIYDKLLVAFIEINSDNQKQYELISNRRILTAGNINSLNILYSKLIEICDIGKLLYKKSQPAKVPDYTFSYLKKQVRMTIKKVTEETEKVVE